MFVLGSIKTFLILGVILTAAVSLTWVVYTLTSGAAAKVESEYIAASLQENVKANENKEKRYNTLLIRTDEVRAELETAKDEARLRKDKIENLKLQMGEGSQICLLSCIVPDLLLD